LPQERMQFRSRMETSLSARIHLLYPPFEEAFLGPGLSSQSNYKREFHVADPVILLMDGAATDR
jgi:hypothetical protein